MFLERGANLGSRAAHTPGPRAHTHPKNTQVPPPPGSKLLSAIFKATETLGGALVIS